MTKSHKFILKSLKPIHDGWAYCAYCSCGGWTIKDKINTKSLVPQPSRQSFLNALKGVHSFHVANSQPKKT